MTVPYQFANATGNINLSELDANFDSLGVFSTNAATVTANAQPNVTSVGTLVSLTATGNIRSVNGYLFGDGRFITNLPAANGTYGNANVASYLPTYNGTLAPSTINTSGTVTAANVAVTNIATFARSVTMGQGLQVTNDINSYGNVIGKNFVSATGNANVANVNTNAVSTVALTATGLVTVGTLIPTTITGNGNIFANFITANANLSVSGRITTNGVVIANQGFATNATLTAGNASISGSINTGSLTASGNVSGQYLRVATQTIASARVTVGQAGQMIALSDSNPGGKLAYWDTTNSRWNYIKDDSAV